MKKIVIILLLQYAFVYAQWVPITNVVGGDIETIIIHNTDIYAAGTVAVFKSTNYGVNWSTKMTSPAMATRILLNFGSNFFCGISNATNTLGGVYKAANYDSNFSVIGLINKPVKDLVGDSQQLIAVTSESNIPKVYRSSNNGSNWSEITSNIYGEVWCAAVYDNKIYVGGQQLFVSSNSGTNWNIIFDLSNTNVIGIKDSLILLGTEYQGIYRSSNLGQSWVKTYSSNREISAIYIYGQNVFAAGDKSFLVSTNAGLNFTDRTENLGNSNITSIALLNNVIYISNGIYATQPVSIWKRPLNELIGISQISSEIPINYRLYQNYPNPFNPMTNIKFDVPATPQNSGKENVILKIYDVLGKEITTLVDKELSPGTYEVNFDGTNYPSGIYYCRMSFGESATVNKMILLK